MKKLLTDPVFDGRCWFVYDEPWETFSALVMKEAGFFPARDRTEDAYCYYAVEPQVGFVFLPARGESIEELCDLDHEIGHFVFNHLDAKGCKLGTDSEELYTYYKTHYFKSALLAVKDGVK